VNLTRRQRGILEFVREFCEQRGYSPSLQEIGRHFGLRSPATVHKHLRNLEAKGALRRGWNRSRSIEVLPEQGRSPAYDLAIVGTLGGDRALELRSTGETISVPERLVGERRSWVLSVFGPELESDLLRDGDQVVVEQDRDPPPGSVVIVLLGGSRPEIWRYARQGQTVRLTPLEGAGSRVLDAAEVTVQGRVRGIIRQY